MSVTMQLPMMESIAAPPPEVVTITSEQLQAAADHWIAAGDVRLGTWLRQLADPAALDLVPLRIAPSLAVELQLTPEAVARTPKGHQALAAERAG